MIKDKNLFQDMVRVKKAGPSKLPTLANKKIEKAEISPKTKKAQIVDNNIDNSYQKTKSEGKNIFWILAIVCIVGLFFTVSFVFGKIIVNIEPDSKAIALNDTLSAVKNPSANELSFDLISFSAEESKIISGGEEKQVETRATGTVVIYNSFSSAPQSLNIDTRLIASDGRIYKTDKKITVPGMKKDGTPGSVEVGIYAEKAGDQYNSSPLDFKIFGFKGTSKYDKFFAKSKGNISGGFVGLKKEVSELEKISALSELKKNIRENLITKAEGQIPEDTILFKDASSFVISSEPLEEVVDSGVKFTLKGTFYGVLFKEQALSKAIAQKQIDKYDGAPIDIPQIRSLKFAFKDPELVLSDAKQIDFNLSGNIIVVFKVDSESFKKELLGQKKTVFSDVLKNFPSIKSANINPKPFWLQSFPENPKKVIINVNYPN